MSTFTNGTLDHHHNHNVVERFVGFRLAGAYLEPNPSDFNLDSLVDEADLQLWQESFGASSSGDADRDGDTDGNDFLIWQRELSFVEPSSPINVPEPSSGLLLVWLASAVLLGGIKRDQKTDDASQLSMPTAQVLHLGKCLAGSGARTPLLATLRASLDQFSLGRCRRRSMLSRGLVVARDSSGTPGRAAVRCFP